MEIQNDFLFVNDIAVNLRNVYYFFYDSLDDVMILNFNVGGNSSNYISTIVSKNSLFNFLEKYGRYIRLIGFRKYDYCYANSNFLGSIKLNDEKSCLELLFNDLNCFKVLYDDTVLMKEDFKKTKEV